MSNAIFNYFVEVSFDKLMTESHKLIKILTVSLVFLYCNSQGQTINLNSRPLAGDVLQFKMDTMSIDTNILGWAATWDFSQLIFSDSIYYSALDGNNTSNLENFYTDVFFNTENGQMMYYESNNLNLLEIGFPSSPGCNRSYISPLKILKYPFGFNDTLNSSYIYFADCPWKKYTGHGSIAVKGDGSGTLILPDGIYTNVLRVKSVYYTQNNGVSKKTLKYDWYASSHKFPLLSYVVKYYFPYTTSNFDNKYVKILVNESYAGIQSMQNDLLVGPNPATNYLNIIGESDFNKAEIFNGFGLKVCEFQISESNSKLDISKLENGIYMILLSNKSQSVCKKIAIHH